MAALEPILPVLVLVVTIGAVLLGALLKLRRGLILVALIGLAVAVASALTIKLQTSNSTFSAYLFFDPLYRFVTVFLCTLLAGVLLVSSSLWQTRPPGVTTREGDPDPGPAWEWPVYLCLLLGSLIGMILLASARHLIFLAIAFEMASLPSYVLVGFRRFSIRAAEGAAKYVIFGAVCSSLMVYGISLLYGVTGTFDWEKAVLHLATGGLSLLTLVALVCLFVGLAFKISLVPMHFWCPDAFEAAGADIAAWLSVASKSAALLVLARLVHILLPAIDPTLGRHLMLALAVIAIVTMTLANLSAYWQTSVKRLLAYSSIAHAGYIVCGVLVFADTTGQAAIVAYILIYLLMNLGAFTVAGLVERHTGADRLDQFVGLGTRNPGLAAAMMIFLFSLVGLPPLAGFAVKWIILAALWQHQLAFVAVAVLANTLLSLFYYMRIARAMYFSGVAGVPVAAHTPAQPQPAGAGPDWGQGVLADGGEPTAIAVPGPTAIVLAVCAVALLVLFVGWGLLNAFSLNLLSLAF